MLKCIDCGHLFEEAKRYSEKVGEYWGSPYCEERSGCPLCLGAYDEAVACKICGSYEDVEDEEEYCEMCKEKILKRFNDFVSSNFTEKERRVLNELYDGKEI